MCKINNHACGNVVSFFLTLQNVRFNFQIVKKDWITVHQYQIVEDLHPLFLIELGNLSKYSEEMTDALKVVHSCFPYVQCAVSSSIVEEVNLYPGLVISVE